MKSHLKKALIVLVIAIAFGGLGYHLISQSEHEDIDWKNYEHTDIYTFHYYLELDTKEKVAYENIMKEYQSFPERIEIPSLSEAELKKVFTAVLYDNPLLFCFNKTCNIVATDKKTYFVPDYSMPKEEYEAKLREIQNLTPDIISNLPANEFDIELYLHDYITDRCTYTDTDSENERNLYGALITGKASCEGYSHAMNYLAELCNIDSYVIFGSAEAKDGSNGNHMWNIIKIDGEYYHLDATWNDTVSQEDNSSEHRYMYFNITDEEISKTHSDFETEDKCTSLDANYYVRKNLFYKTFGEYEKNKLAEIIADAVDANQYSVSIKLENDSLFKQVEKDLISDKEIYVILSRANKKSDKKLNTQTIHYRSMDDVRVLEIMYAAG